MKIIALDDEKIALQGMISSIQKVAPDAKVYGFRYASEAVDHMKNEPCDIAFLDIEMKETNGVTVAKMLKEINPDINIIFATGFGSYRDEAFDLHASGYLIKPITAEAVKRELDNLRRPVHKPKKLKAITFGNFQVLYGEEHVFFNLRTQIFEIIQNRTSPILDRVQKIFDTYDISLPQKTMHEWADIFLGLERLDTSWTDMLNDLKNITPSSVSAEFDIVFEQLLIYFFYRHLPDALWDNMFKERILFAIICFYMIYALCSIHKTKNGNLNFDDICEISRMYSSEIEYNEENIAFLLEILSD